MIGSVIGAYTINKTKTILEDDNTSADINLNGHDELFIMAWLRKLSVTVTVAINKEMTTWAKNTENNDSKTHYLNNIINAGKAKMRVIGINNP